MCIRKPNPTDPVPRRAALDASREAVDTQWTYRNLYTTICEANRVRWQLPRRPPRVPRRCSSGVRLSPRSGTARVRPERLEADADGGQRRPGDSGTRTRWRLPSHLRGEAGRSRLRAALLPEANAADGEGRPRSRWQAVQADRLRGSGQGR